MRDVLAGKYLTKVRSSACDYSSSSTETDDDSGSSLGTLMDDDCQLEVDSEQLYNDVGYGVGVSMTNIESDSPMASDSMDCAPRGFELESQIIPGPGPDEESRLSEELLHSDDQPIGNIEEAVLATARDDHHANVLIQLEMAKRRRKYTSQVRNLLPGVESKVLRLLFDNVILSCH